MRKKVFIALKMASIAGQEKLAGIFRFLGENHDWDITLIRTAAELSPDKIREALKTHHDGFIISVPDIQPVAALLAHSNTPTIVLDIHDPNLTARKKNIVFIRNSPEEIGRAAANFLLSTGRCRSYAFMQNPTIVEWSVNRFKFFRETLRDHGFWCNSFTDPRSIHRLERPVGIFTANDDCGYTFLEYCRTHHLRVPEDFLVIGTDNDTLICENCRPRLTSIQPDFEQEGFLAAQSLHDLMKRNNCAVTTSQSHNPPIRFVGVKTIVRRDSTADISHGGKLVQKALAYIRANALKGISPRDVVAHLGCSRRLADLRFRNLQGRSIGEAIIAHRLEEVRRLLTTTQDSMESIAAYCGFRNSNYLKNLFKHRFSLTMRDYRARNRISTSTT